MPVVLLPTALSSKIRCLTILKVASSSCQAALPPFESLNVHYWYALRQAGQIF